MLMKKPLMAKLAIAAFVTASIAVWCASRWNTWFHNPAEAPYEASPVPSMVLLTFGDSDGMNRNVSWTCGKEVDSAASLDLFDVTDRNLSQVKAEGESFKSRGGQAAYYVARLRHLKPGHQYRYRVCAGDEESAWHSFSLPRKEEKDMSFLYFGDIQDTIGGRAGEMVEQAVGRNADARFIVCGGDLTERPTDTFWKETFRDIGGVGTSMPVITAPGNHEYLKGVICELERRFTLIHSYYLDSKIEDNHVFTVRVGDSQIFVLDSNREFFYLFTQARWLKQQLKSSRAKWKIVVLHHPLYSIKGTTNNVIQRWMFDGYVREYGVDMVLQAHEHEYARMTAHAESGDKTTPVYTVSHCSPKSYRIEFDDSRFDKYGVGGRYYQKVRSHADTLFMTTYNALDGSLYDSLYVVKTGGKVSVHDCGAHIREVLQYDGDPDNGKDQAFMQRIREYGKRHHCIVK